MSKSILWVLLFSFCPVLTAIAGAILGTLRTPSPRLRSAIQHFAAGVVFSVVSVELLPDIVKIRRPVWVAIGFSLGIGSMLAIRWFTENKLAKPNNGDAKRFPTALVAATGIDILVDGFLVGVGFSAGAKEGVLLVAALASELFSLGIATSVTLAKSGVSRARAVGTCALVVLTMPLGALAGTTILRNSPAQCVEALLSFGLAALLFLVTEELLVEAHEVPETPLITASFFAGFLVFLVLGMIA